MSAFREDLLAGRAAFVAGGTSGINLGIAKRFAELGASVAVLGRDAEKAARAGQEIGRGAAAVTADVRDYAAVRAAMEQAAERIGRFDIVVSGAAGNFLAPALGMSANAFKAVVDIDLIGTFNVFRGCHDLLNRPGASLIAISAGQAVNAMTFQAHACAAKAGVNQLVRTLALEWGPDVRVNAISPGPIADTEGLARLAQTSRETMERAIALKRWGTAHEIGEAAAFLSSPSAAYITGIVLDVDGGWGIGDATRQTIPARPE